MHLSIYVYVYLKKYIFLDGSQYTSLSKFKSCMTAKSVPGDGTLQLRYCFCTGKYCNLLSRVFFFSRLPNKSEKGPPDQRLGLLYPE